jgi:hypothetical protein
MTNEKLLNSSEEEGKLAKQSVFLTAIILGNKVITTLVKKRGGGWIGENKL